MLLSRVVWIAPRSDFRIHMHRLIIIIIKNNISNVKFCNSINLSSWYLSIDISVLKTANSLQLLCFISADFSRPFNLVCDLLYKDAMNRIFLNADHHPVLKFCHMLRIDKNQWSSPLKILISVNILRIASISLAEEYGREFFIWLFLSH